MINHRPFLSGQMNWTMRWSERWPHGRWKLRDRVKLAEDGPPKQSKDRTASAKCCTKTLLIQDQTTISTGICKLPNLVVFSSTTRRGNALQPPFWATRRMTENQSTRRTNCSLGPKCFPTQENCRGKKRSPPKGHSGKTVLISPKLLAFAERFPMRGSCADTQSKECDFQVLQPCRALVLLVYSTLWQCLLHVDLRKHIIWKHIMFFLKWTLWKHLFILVANIVLLCLVLVGCLDDSIRGEKQ